MFSWFTKKQQSANWKDIYSGSKNLPSFSEMIQKNVSMLLNQQEGKYIQTTDKTTIDIVENIYEKNKFVRDMILGNPGQSTSETQSLKVKICDINKSPKLKNSYQQWAQKGKKRIIAIGGPSAHDQTLIASLIPSIRQNHDVHFYCRTLLESNLLHCALQSHARHGCALNSDPIVSGRHLLPLIFKRLLLGVTFEDAVNKDFIKIDVKLNNFAYLMVYVKNQLNGLLQIYKSWRGRSNEHDLNRFQSVVSQQIQRFVQTITKSSFTSRNVKKQSQEMAIHLVYNQQQLDDIIQQHKQQTKIEGITIQEVSKQELKQLFPYAKDVLMGFRYIGDYATKLTMYEQQKKKAEQMGAVWTQNKTVSKVFVDKDQKGNPFACGVQFTDGEYVPADKIHLTLGYKAGYYFQDTNVRAVKNINIPVAGVSTNFILQKTPQIKNIIQNKGGSLQLDITSGNWTFVGHNDKYVIVRGTAGGNTGSQAYQPSHFLNLCLNTRNIFGDAFVGILSVYGCPRSVNYKNSTQFCRLANGLIISHGKGGTGNTKRASQAYKALTYLGLGKQVEQYFSKVESKRMHIVNGMNKVMKQGQQVGFYYDYTSQTKKNVFKNLI